MKTTTMIIAAILITNFAMATGNLRVSFLPVGSDNARLEITNSNTSQFEIDVKDDNGDVVFFKKTKDLATNYQKMYDFSALEDGFYTLSVKIDNEKNESRFSIERGNVVVLDEKKFAKPYFTFDDNVFKMTYLNFSNDPLKMFVYGDKGLLKEKNLSKEFAVHEGLDFSKAERGAYRVIVEHGLEMFEYNVNVD